MKILDNVSTRSWPIKVPSHLLSSRLGTQGLHPVGALTRPHERNKDQKSKNKKTNPNGRPRRKELVIIFPQRRSLGLKPVPDFLRRHVHHGRPSTRRPPRVGAGRHHVPGRRAGARGLLLLRCGLPRALAQGRLDHQIRPCGRLVPGRLRRRQVRPAALGRPSRRGRCCLPLRDDDVVLPLQSRLVAAGFLWRGLGASGAATRRGVTSKAPSAIAAAAASAWALAAASARAFAASSSCAALAAAALNSSASLSSRASRAFRSVAA